MTILMTGTGLITAGERQIIISPRDSGLEPKHGALYLHGAGAGADAHLNYGNQALTTNALARAGVVGVSADFAGPQTWGNNAAMASMTQAYNWLQAQTRNVKYGRVAVHGGSMGGLNALVWAGANRDKVSCVSLEVPVIDLDGIWRANIGGFRPLINTAYGGLWDAAYTIDKDPLTMAANGVYDGLPILLNYGDTDAICLPEKAEQFLSLVPSAIGFELTGGHFESTQLQVDRDYQTEFILSYS